MPRIADRDERRSTIAAAYRSVLATSGPAAATFTRVAEVAGVSVGLIQHYFADRAALLLHAYEEGMRALTARVDGVVAAGEADEQPIAVLIVDGLGQLLPLDAERAGEFRVRQSLVAAAAHDAVLLRVAQGAAAALHDRVRTAVANGKRCGEVEPDVDADAAARMLLATTQGLAEGIALGDDPAAAQPVLRHVAGLVFTGECHHYDRRAAQPEAAAGRSTTSGGSLRETTLETPLPAMETP